jgi:2-keto-4-pentenoate hydratase/2-oxohepta-3-ene-1,7-dioic acid hydratase in catechol pathway
MRLVSYAPEGAAPGTPWRAGIVRGDEVVDAAEAAASLLDGGPAPTTVREVLGLGDRLRDLARAAHEGASAAGRLDALTLGPPVPDPDKVLCIGLNYTAHAEETQLDTAAVPTVFAKFRNSLVGAGSPIVIPPATSEVDYEGELGVVIGRRCARVSRDAALDVVAGVMPLNDVSARDLQFQTTQWTPGKAIDTFAPCGPELVLLDEIDDVQDLHVMTRVNGNVVQDARTSQMIFTVAHIVSFLSSFTTLEVGDVIASGTPAGVGFTREPPLLLHDGDEVEVEVEGIGVLRNPVHGEQLVPSA